MAPSYGLTDVSRSIPIVIGVWRKGTPALPNAILINIADRSICRTSSHVRMQTRLSKKSHRAAAVLIASAGRHISHADLFDALYGDREDGGPLGNAVSNVLCRVRPALAALGVQIEPFNGMGFRVRVLPLAEGVL